MRSLASWACPAVQGQSRNQRHGRDRKIPAEDRRQARCPSKTAIPPNRDGADQIRQKPLITKFPQQTLRTLLLAEPLFPTPQSKDAYQAYCHV